MLLGNVLGANQVGSEIRAPGPVLGWMDGWKPFFSSLSWLSPSAEVSLKGSPCGQGTQNKLCFKAQNSESVMKKTLNIH